MLRFGKCTTVSLPGLPEFHEIVRPFPHRRHPTGEPKMRPAVGKRSLSWINLANNSLLIVGVPGSTTGWAKDIEGSERENAPVHAGAASWRSFCIGRDASWSLEPAPHPPTWSAINDTVQNLASRQYCNCDASDATLWLRAVECILSDVEQSLD